MLPSQSQSSTPTPRYVALDSWRGLCALLVTLFHFPIDGVVHDNGFIRHSYLFVDFFFVLSGFIIAYTQNRRPDAFAPFLMKRFGRVWPLHVAVLAVFIAVAVLQGDLGRDEGHSVGAIFTNLLMIHAWGMHNALTWNDPSWSISVEWLLYIIFALLAFVPGRRFIYGLLVMVGIGALFFFAPHGMGSTFDFGICRGLAGFFVGALIARAPSRPFGTWAEVVTTVAVVGFVALGRAAYIAPFIFGAAVWVFSGSRGVLSRWLETKPFVWLGERSYTTYIVHAMVVAAVWTVARKLGWPSQRGVLSAGAWGDLITIPYIAAILVIAWAAYPFEDFCRRRFKTLADRLPGVRRAVPAREVG